MDFSAEEESVSDDECAVEEPNGEGPAESIWTPNFANNSFTCASRSASRFDKSDCVSLILSLFVAICSCILRVFSCRSTCLACNVCSNCSFCVRSFSNFRNNESTLIVAAFFLVDLLVLDFRAGDFLAFDFLEDDWDNDFFAVVDFAFVFVFVLLVTALLRLAELDLVWGFDAGRFLVWVMWSLM